MEDHSLRPNNSTGFQHDGDSDTVYHLTTPKAMGRPKQQSRIIRASWNGRYLEEDRLCRALLQYKNTPSAKDGQSPAQKLYGHPVQDTIPAHGWSLDSTWQHSKEEATRYYNQRVHTLPDIREGSHVAIQHPRTKVWDTYGIVTYVGPHRQYYVKTRTGAVLKRNRRYLRRRVPTSIPQQERSTGSTPSQPAQDTSPILTPQPPPRRSTQPRKPIQQLVEDPSWN